MKQKHVEIRPSQIPIIISRNIRSTVQRFSYSVSQYFHNGDVRKRVIDETHTALSIMQDLPDWQLAVLSLNEAEENSQRELKLAFSHPKQNNLIVLAKT